MSKDLLVLVLIIAVVGLGVLGFTKPMPNIIVEVVDRLGGANQFEFYPKFFHNEVTFGVNGTAFNQFNCDTVSWDPASVTSTTPTTLDIANAGAALGDVVLASFASATTTDLWRVDGVVTGAGTSTIRLFGNGPTALDLSSATARVCTFQF